MTYGSFNSEWGASGSLVVGVTDSICNSKHVQYQGCGELQRCSLSEHQTPHAFEPISAHCIVRNQIHAAPTFS